MEKKKKRGRKPTGKGTQIQVRVSPNSLDAAVVDNKTRPEAIRRPVDEALVFTKKLNYVTTYPSPRISAAGFQSRPYPVGGDEKIQNNWCYFSTFYYFLQNETLLNHCENNKLTGYLL